MGLFQKSDVFLWIVPPHSGRVRKFRFTVRFLAALLLTCALMASTFLFVTGDYTRVQLARLKNYLTLKNVMAERDGLRERTRQLRSKVETLKSANSSAAEKERQVHERLESLAKILKSVPFKGLLKGEERQISKKNAKESVGGAELDCSDGRCADLIKESEKDRASLGLPPLKSNVSFEPDLVESLDQYIELLSSLPFGPPVRGEIHSGYGYRISPFEGRTRMHEGVDFALSYGTPIHVTADGKVIEVVRDGTYGLRVDVEHRPGVVTRYAHLSKFAVAKGQKVKRGEVLGYCGSTGRSTGPHLHYEVLVQGSPKDPEVFIALADKLAEVLGS